MFQEISVFNRGLVLGLIIAAPVGPIGLLTIRRTLQRGLLIGFTTGLGAAVADTIFGAVAAFSVSVIVEFLQRYSPALRILGGAFMLIIAWRTWHDRPHEPTQQDESLGNLITKTRHFGKAVSSFIGSLLITLTNPVTIFATIAIVATFGEIQSSTDALTIVSGIFCGSTLWWIILSASVAVVRGYLTEDRITIINRFTAGTLSVLALWAMVSGVRQFLKI